LAFAGAYLFYLPARLKGFSYGRKNGTFVVNTGVFGRKAIALPQDAIQAAAISADPLCRMLGLATVTVLAAGFRASVPGLPLADAKALAEALSP
jgi:membrane protein YdbS with pleckstrin-like domain